MKQSKTKIKKLISITNGFLLTLLFFTLSVCIGLGIGVFNSRSVISKINETDYYNNIYEDLNKKAEEIVLQAGLPTTVLQNVITLERVYSAGSNYIDTTLEGKKPQINTDRLQINFTNNINQYFMDNGIEQTEKIKAGQAKVVTRLIQVYGSNIKFKFVDQYTDFSSEFWNLMKFFLPMNVILIGILCFFLLKMHRYLHRGLRYINYAMIASSFIIVLCSVYLRLNKGYEKLNVMPDYYRDFLEAYFKWGISVFLYIGGLGIILSILMISFTGFLKKRNS